SHHAAGGPGRRHEVRGRAAPADVGHRARHVPDLPQELLARRDRAARIAGDPLVTGARALYEALRDCGVTHLFGLDSPEALYAEIDRAEMRPITVRDERSGAIMADAYARVSGRPAVCTAIRGPGATNLITGVAEAWAASSPVIAVVNDVSTGLVGKNPIQEVDHLALFAPVTKWAGRLDRPERAGELLLRAVATATSGRPGPALLSCPDDVLARAGSAGPAPRAGIRRYPHTRAAPDPSAVRDALAVLVEARRPAIVAGGGVLISGASAELREVADLLGAPVATTLLGKGSVDETHPLSAGVVGAYTGGELGRGRVANDVVRAADTVLLVGTKTGNVTTADWTVPDPASRVVHVDVDAAEIGRNYRSLGVLGDAKLALRALADGLRAAGVEPSRDARVGLARGLAEWRERIEPYVTSTARPIRPERVPAAIGAKLARPDRRVLCLTGDGAFGYVFQELETAARYQIPIVVVVLNNSSFGFQKHAEHLQYGRAFETALLDVDYGALARTLHCDGVSVSDPEELAPALGRAIRAERPTVINVVVDPD